MWIDVTAISRDGRETIHCQVWHRQAAEFHSMLEYVRGYVAVVSWPGPA